MSPLEKLEEGILYKNWSKVCEGYNDLTGKKLTVSQNDFASKESIIKTIEHLFGYQENYDGPKITNTKEESFVATPIAREETKTSHFGNKTMPITNEDLGEEVTPEMIQANELKDKIAKQRKKPRKAENYKVECSICGRPFNSPFKLAELGQRCSSCIKNRSTDDEEDE